MGPYAPDTVTEHVEVSPTVTRLEHVSDVVVLAGLTVTSEVPELPALFVSPPYVAVMFCGEPTVVVGVYWTLQAPPLRVQVVELNHPAPEAANDTVSPSVEPYAPDTVTEHVELVPTVVGLVHVSDVVVLAGLTVTSEVPELPALMMSPG
jgi:hypothetical protein